MASQEIVESQESLGLDFATGARDFVKDLPPRQTFTKLGLKALIKSAKDNVTVSNIGSVFLNYASGAYLFALSLQGSAYKEWTKDELLDLATMRYTHAREAYLCSLRN